MNGVLRGLLGATAASLLAACGPPDRARREASSITILDSFYDERVTGPLWAAGARFLVFLPLTESVESEGRVVGRLAERWSHSPDRLAWTFHLRQGVRWHDGVAVTARDVEFSLSLYRHPALSWDAPDAYDVRVLDDSTFTVTYRRPPRDPFHGWKVIWPKHLLDRLDPQQINEWEFWVHPVGNGPYRYVRHVPKTMLELEANPDYAFGTPRIGRVIFKFGGGAPIAELLSGNVDVLTIVNQADLPKIAADQRFRIYHQIGPIGLEAIYWNHRSPLFSDVRVRQALTLALDRRELRRVLNLPPDLLISDALFTVRQYHRRELPEPWPYDPDSAARLLEVAGWRREPGSAVRSKGGREFRFVALVPSGGLRVLERAGVYFQAQLQRLGVQMDLQSLELTALQPRLRSGRFDAAFFAFWNQVDGGAWTWFGEDSPLGYRNPRMISLLREVKAATDPEEIDRIYRSLMPIFRADLPVTFLFPQVVTYVAHRRIQGLSSPFRADPVQNLEHLWLEEP